MKNRVCTECGRTFQPSSGHLRCPSCRSRDLSYDLCACGARKHKQSSTCAACRTEKGASARYEGILDVLGITGAMANGSDKAERADG